MAEASKEKVEVKRLEDSMEIVEAEPVAIYIELSQNVEIIEKIAELAKEHSGNRPLELHIRSKLADVVIESQLYVNESIVEAFGEYLAKSKEELNG
jgi:DNA polymerase-3 subunit alpha